MNNILNTSDSPDELMRVDHINCGWNCDIHVKNGYRIHCDYCHPNEFEYKRHE